MYDKKIDKKWQDVWEKAKCFHAVDDFSKKKFYSLIEFPYPSGIGLHVGHVRAYMSMDVMSRMKRMKGYNVLFPIGFDAFGLPTENYAMKTGIHPRKVTDNNIATFTKQLKSVGFSFDWDRVIDTTTPEYVKWTQWIFLKLFEHGMAYKDTTYVNYCPKCRVILANEESQGGLCDRCDSQIVQKEKEVWMLKITDYADKLLDELENLDFTDRVKTEQQNWIGRSYGAEIDFDIENTDKQLKVYTTRPDTIFGVTFMAIAPEHKLLDELREKITNFDEILEYRKKASEKTEFERTKLVKDKTGVKVQGISCINPVTNERIPLVVADYVMLGYGTGAIMAVPAHDERDYEFAKKFNIDIKQVIAMDYTDITNPPKEGVPNKEGNGVLVVLKHWNEEKYICSIWKNYDWKNLITGGIESGETALETAVREVKEETGYVDVKNVSYIPFEHFDSFYAAHKGVNKKVHQRDVFVELASDKQIEVSEEEKALVDNVWLTKQEMLETINKAHHKLVFDICVNGGRAYTGDGILINSEFLNGLNIKEATLKINEYLAENKLGTPKTNYHMKDWAFARQRYWGEPVPIVKCAKCGLVPMNEKDLPLTLPELKDFMPGEDGESPLAKIDSWVKTTCPKCGNPAERETDTMPQWAGSSWYYLRYIDPKNNEALASADKLKYWLQVDCYNGGMEHVTRHLIYSRFWHRFLYDIGVVPTKEPYAKRTTQGLILGPDGEKMSKSKGNVVNPDDIINQFGADTLRTYILFIGEYSQSAPWSENGVKGSKKFLDRIMRLKDLVTNENTDSKDLDREMHLMIKKVSNDYEDMKYNTAIACMMSYINLLYKQDKINIKYVKPLLQVLNPVAPHVTEELWELLKLENNIYSTPWPEYDENKMVSDNIEMAVLINGTVRFKVTVGSDLNETEIENIVRNDDKLKQYTVDKKIKKIIVVKGRVVNIVINYVKLS